MTAKEIMDEIDERVNIRVDVLPNGSLEERLSIALILEEKNDPIFSQKDLLNGGIEKLADERENDGLPFNEDGGKLRYIKEMKKAISKRGEREDNMRAKIEYIDLWFENDVTVAQVYYSAGSVKRFYMDYGRSFPKSVDAFLDTHEHEPLNSSVERYK